MQHINKFKNEFHKKFCSWNCPIWFKNMQSFLQIIVHAKAFEIFIVLCIIINTIFLAADHHDADDNLKNALSIGNSGVWLLTRAHLIVVRGTRDVFNDVLVFTYIFAAEAFLKILALGFITYLQDPWNTFDFVIVIISISDVFISLTSSSDEAQNSGLNVLRTLRFMVKNVHYWCCRSKVANSTWEVYAVGLKWSAKISGSNMFHML